MQNGLDEHLQGLAEAGASAFELGQVCRTVQEDIQFAMDGAADTRSRAKQFRSEAATIDHDRTVARPGRERRRAGGL
ncbi:hypothetical protein [Streptomyces olivoreticuli]|uniref:hypothetical protein n=1 Tax=Streptomyces olivoreticuli TaxID=68246 RepID=UPI0013C2D768|nr:hypothetical protein [Streptomyces olivoreticuli]